MLVSNAIPSMFNGVSQQPAQLRHSSQCELMDNAYPSIATGLRKRPPTIHMSKLRSQPLGSVYSHTINRDTSERYEVIVMNGGIEVYNINTGAAVPVSFPNGADYLLSADPATSFSLTTVADYTFVINKERVVEVDEQARANNPKNVGYVSVAASPAQHSFTIIVDGFNAGATLGTEGATIAQLAGKLYASLKASLNQSIYQIEIVSEQIVKITRLDGAPIQSLSVADSFGNTALKDLSNGVTRFADLPAKFDTGYTITVKGDPGNDSATYHVEYKDGGWVETTAPGSLNTLAARTMPHQLIRKSDGTFEFSQSAWEPRKVGDDNSNPKPSFVGRKIADVFFFRNRLGMLSDENVILSAAGEYFKFFAGTARAVLESDPIDVTAPGTKVSLLRYAVPFNKVLLLFSDQTQFQLTSGDILSPKSVRIDVATNFESSSLCRPQSLGQELFFPVIRGKHTALREYYVDNQSVSNDAMDATAHVATFLPADVFKLAASSNEDAIIAISRQERNVLYLYKFYWAKQDKLQSAWGRLVFPTSDAILNADFVANKLFLVIQRADGIYLEHIDFQDALVDEGLGWLVNLDRRVILTGTYNEATNVTSWTLPYADMANFKVVLGADFASKVGQVLDVTRLDPYTLRAVGNYGGGRAFVGRTYEMRYRYSTQYHKDAQGNALQSAKLQLKKMFLSYTDSGHFRVEVTPQARATYTYRYTNKYLGDSTMFVGAAPMDSGVFPFPVQTSNVGVQIDIINDSPYPSTFQSTEWEGELTVRARR
jgi:hypothetical protein